MSLYVIAVLSAHEDRNLVAQCISLGAIDFWVKPLRPNEVGNLWTKVWRSTPGEVRAVIDAELGDSSGSDEANTANGTHRGSNPDGTARNGSGSGPGTLPHTSGERPAAITNGDGSGGGGDASGGNGANPAVASAAVDNAQVQSHHHHHHHHHHKHHKHHKQQLEGKNGEVCPPPPPKFEAATTGNGGMSLQGMRSLLSGGMTSNMPGLRNSSSSSKKKSTQDLAEVAEMLTHMRDMPDVPHRSMILDGMTAPLGAPPLPPSTDTGLAQEGVGAGPSPAGTVVVGPVSVPLPAVAAGDHSGYPQGLVRPGYPGYMPYQMPYMLSSYGFPWVRQPQMGMPGGCASQKPEGVRKTQDAGDLPSQQDAYQQTASIAQKQQQQYMASAMAGFSAYNPYASYLPQGSNASSGRSAQTASDLQQAMMQQHAAMMQQHAYMMQQQYSMQGGYPHGYAMGIQAPPSWGNVQKQHFSTTNGTLPKLATATDQGGDQMMKLVRTNCGDVIVGDNGQSKDEQRKAAVEKYKEKRKNLNASNKIRYQTRKTLAASRPRMKGQFVKSPALTDAQEVNSAAPALESGEGQEGVKEKEDEVDTLGSQDELMADVSGGPARAIVDVGGAVCGAAAAPNPSLKTRARRQAATLLVRPGSVPDEGESATAPGLGLQQKMSGRKHKRGGAGAPTTITHDQEKKGSGRKHDRSDSGSNSPVDQIDIPANQDDIMA